MASIPRPDMPEPLLPSEQPPELPVPGGPEPEMDPSQPVPEIGGRDGPDPVRYGDWERRGVAVDF
ncbi:MULTISPECIES: DUF1674 domain-containing protein [Sphingosinicellaceae]|uniref:DUF1674 domain-containing protein n=1 Tax=Sphingosinicellaceae TaxID=2820280 RepID=UPI001D01902A|nr:MULTISPECIES: DUF1674 domain-containing protein [Polymorphobacter]